MILTYCVKTICQIVSNPIELYQGITSVYLDRIYGPGDRRFASQHEVRCEERGRVLPQKCKGEVCSEVGIDSLDIDAVRGHNEVIDDVAQRGCGPLRLIAFRPLAQP